MKRQRVRRRCVCVWRVVRENYYYDALPTAERGSVVSPPFWWDIGRRFVVFAVSRFSIKWIKVIRIEAVSWKGSHIVELTSLRVF